MSKCPRCSTQNEIEEVLDSFYFNKVKYRCAKCESVWTFTDYSFTKAKEGLRKLLDAEKNDRPRSVHL